MMKMLLIIFALLVLTTDTKEVGNNGDHSCIYAFTNPVYPSFILPPAQPNSPGDVQLNKNNPIRLANGTSLAAGQGCNSRGFFYYNNVMEQFSSTYLDSNEQSTSITDVIYATNHDQLNARTIQENQANLASFLAGKILKIDLICNNGLLGCAYFTVGGNSSNTLPTLPTNKAMKGRGTMAIIVLLYYCTFYMWS